jgi:excisionase family DNA binding protein
MAVSDASAGSADKVEFSTLQRVKQSEELLAQLLGMERLQVLELVRAGMIKAKKVGDNYRILGSNLVEYMNR